MLEKLPKMSAREALINLAGRPPAYGEQPRWLQYVAKLAGITPRTARSLWNDEIKKADHQGMKLVHRALEDRQRIEEARRDAATVADIFHRHAQALVAIDPDFHRPTIDAFVEAARVIGRRDRA